MFSSKKYERAYLRVKTVLHHDTHDAICMMQVYVFLKGGGDGGSIQLTSVSSQRKVSRKTAINQVLTRDFYT